MSLNVHQLHQLIVMALAGFSVSVSMPARAEDPLKVLNFSGKSVLAAWDLGVAEAMLEEPINVLSGNSSGSILAAYFACHGLSQESISALQARLLTLDLDALTLPTIRKKQYLMFGRRTEKGLGDLRALIESSLTMNDGELCDPSTANPMIIVTTNGDVVDRRTSTSFANSGPALFHSSDDRQLEEGTYNVYMDVDGEEQSGFLGKACTTFVSPSLFSALSNVPPSERQCDVRELKSGRDIVLAVLASIAEPTFFYAVRDIDTSDTQLFRSGLYYSKVADPFWAKIYRSFNDEEVTPLLEKLASFGAKVRDRYFVGGLTNSAPVQDFKRIFPGSTVYSTGRPDHPASVNNLISTWFAVDLNKLYALNRFWVDIDICPDAELWAEFSEAGSNDVDELETLVDKGYSKALACLHKEEACIPKKRSRPKYAAPISTNIVRLSERLRHVEQRSD